MDWSSQRHVDAHKHAPALSHCVYLPSYLLIISVTCSHTNFYTHTHSQTHTDVPLNTQRQTELEKGFMCFHPHTEALTDTRCYLRAVTAG